MESLDNNLLKLLPDAINYIKKKYNLEGDRMEQSVDILDEWIKKQSHLVKKDFDRCYLERCILSSKGSVEKAKRQIDRLCTLKNLVPKYFITCDIKEHFEEILDIVNVIPLPKMTENHQRVLLVKLYDKEFTVVHFLNYFRYLTVLCEYLKCHEYADGFIIIIDFREANLLEFIKKMNPVDVQQITTIMVEGYGARLQGIHLFSRSKVIQLIINTMKPLLSQKIADRVHIHQENEDLYSIVDKDILPMEYGGKERSIFQLQKLWLEELSSEKFENYLTEMKEMRTNESFRQTDEFNEHCMGLPGSFRKLSVD